MAMRNGKMPVQCELCGKTVLRKGIKKHMDMAHGGGRKYAFSGAGVAALSDIKNPSNRQDEQITEIEAQLSDYESQMESEEKRINELETQLADAQIEITATKTLLSDEKAKLNNSESKVQNLEAKLGEIRKTPFAFYDVCNSFIRDLSLEIWKEIGEKKGFLNSTIESNKRKVYISPDGKLKSVNQIPDSKKVIAIQKGGN